MEKPIRSSKLFEGLGTALTDRYRYNPYVRSTIHIILLQMLLAVLVIAAFAFVLRFQQGNTVEALQLDPSILYASDPLAQLANVRKVTLEYTLLGIVALTLLIGYLTARFALRPTKNSLQFQKRFIGNMAHEIRTPLAIIKTNTEVALMDPRLTPDIRETLTTTIQELDRISETINNLLSFDTMVRPSKVTYVELDVTEIADTVVKRHEALARSRGIELTFAADGPHRILANATGIDQVFTNLIKNALNYTTKSDGGSVTVALEGDDQEVRVSITDTGIGIAKKDLYYIFQPFYRADTSRARGVDGGTSGLGLAIVNEIVRAHQGRIFVRSALNRGTTIEITFPKVEPGRASPKESEEEDREHELRVT